MRDAVIGQAPDFEPIGRSDVMKTLTPAREKRCVIA
jgi:hypothetical protein